VHADPESSEAEMMEREREAGFIVVVDDEDRVEEAEDWRVVCNIQPSHSWQNELDALRLVEGSFSLHAGAEECVSRWSSCFRKAV